MRAQLRGVFASLAGAGEVLALEEHLPPHHRRVQRVGVQSEQLATFGNLRRHSQREPRTLCQVSTPVAIIIIEFLKQLFTMYLIKLSIIITGNALLMTRL